MFVSFLDSFVLHSLGFEYGSGSHSLGRLVQSLHETIPVTGQHKAGKFFRSPQRSICSAQSEVHNL